MRPRRTRPIEFGSVGIIRAVRGSGGLRKSATPQGPLFELPGGRLCDPQITSELIRRGDLRPADEGLFGAATAQNFKLTEY